MTIEQLLDAHESGQRVKIPYNRGMGYRWTRAYYQQQNTFRCTLVGHKIGGILDERGYCECFRCGGKFLMGCANPSLWEFFVLLPIYRVKKRMGILP